MKTFILALLACLCFMLFLHNSYAQKQIECVTDAMHERLLKTDPQYKLNNESNKEAILQLLQNQAHRSQQSLITIPVVVHVIHIGEPIGTGSNISDAIIMAKIDSTTAQFRGTKGNSVDTEIQFCLAKTDPYGCATNGITRYDWSFDSSYVNFGFDFGGCDSAADINPMRDSTAWPNTDYYNIWVIQYSSLGSTCTPNSGGGASFPGTLFPHDGTWIGHHSILNLNSGILAHEIGHSLNLIHTFGGPIDTVNSCPVDTNCLVNGDRVCDTPPHKVSDCDTIQHCTPGTGTTGPYNNSRLNYMSYCNSIADRFTQGQKDRMHAAIATSPDRLALSQSTKCNPPPSSIPICEVVNLPSLAGAGDGSVGVTLNPGPTNNTYLWSNGASTATSNGLSAGTYTVTVYSCVDTTSCAVILHDPPVASCQDINAYLNTSGSISIAAAEVDNGSTAISGIDTMTVSPSTFGCFPSTFAMDFDGVDDYVNFGDVSVADFGTNDFSIELWVKLAALPINASGVISKRATCDAANMWNIRIANDGKFFFEVCDAGCISLSSVTALNINTWHHIAVTNSNGYYNLYLDGILSNSYFHNYAKSLNNANELRLGKDACSDFSFGDHLDGQLDDVRIWNTSRTQAELQNNMNMPLSGTEPGLVAYYNLDDGPGSSVVSDGTINNNNGNLTNMDPSTDFVIRDALIVVGSVGTNSVVLTVTDNNGNTETCYATVTVIDTIPPTTICKNDTVYLDASGNASISVADIDNGSTDNCGIDTMTISVSSFDCLDVGVNTVILTVNDVNGNSDTCHAAVMVLDTIVPVAVCKDVSLFLDASGYASITAADVDNGSNDNCGIDTMQLSANSFDCSVLSIAPINTYALDFDGVDDYVNFGDVAIADFGTNDFSIELWLNIDLIPASDFGLITKRGTCNGSNMWNMLLKPDSTVSFEIADVAVVSVKSDITLNSNTWYHIAVTKSSTAYKLYINGILSGTKSHNNGISLNNSNNLLLGKGACGIHLDGKLDEVRIWNTVRSQIEIQNSMNSSFIGSKPGLVAYYNMEDGPGSSTLSDLSGNGNSGTLTNMEPTTDFLSPGAPASTSSQLVSLYVTDIYGNIDSCEALVTVLDTIAPVAICKDDTIYIDAAGNASITASDIDNGSSDNCGIDTITVSPSTLGCFPSTFAMDFDGVDDYVNFGDVSVADFGTNDFSIELWVKLAALPINASGVISKRATCDAANMWNIRIANDGKFFFEVCDAGCISLSSVTALNINTWHHIAVTNSNGYYNLYLDGILSISYFHNYTKSLNNANELRLGKDACSDFSFGDHLDGQLDDVRIWNTSRTQAELQNNMNMPLSGTEPGLVAYYNLDDGPGSSVVNDGTSNNNNGVLTNMDSITDYIYPGAFNEIGMHNVELTVSDNIGNFSTCQATVTLLDTLPPVVVCKDDTVYLDVSGNASITVADIDGGSTDNCGIDTMFISANSFTCANVGSNTVILTVNDVYGNIDTCHATVIVIDTANVATCSVVQHVSCNGGNDGSASVSSNGTGPFTYLWDNGETTATAVSLNAGVHTVVVSDSSGCINSCNVTISEPPALIANCSNNGNVSCNGSSNGAAGVSVTGGTIPYTYLWSSTATTSTINGLTSGTYSVIVTDSLGCADTCDVTITEPQALVASCNNNGNVSCNGGSDGAAGLSVTGGTMPYSYLWSNTATASTISGLTAGTYSVIVTDSLGCTDTCEVNITEPSALVATCQNDGNVTTAGGSNGAASVSAVGGTIPYSYAWSNGSTTSAITGLTAGTYSVIVTDILGCSDTCEVTIAEITCDIVLQSAIASAVTCNSGSDGNISITASSSNTIEYSIDNGASFFPTSSFTSLTAGVYDIIVRNVGDSTCADTTQLTITEPTALVASCTNEGNVTCNGGSDGSASVSVVGGYSTTSGPPIGPNVVGTLGIGAIPRSVAVQGNYAYVVQDATDELGIINISSPVAPSLTGSLFIGGSPQSVYVDGNYAYIVDRISDDLKVINVNNPAVPSLTGSLALGSDPAEVAVAGIYAYVVDFGSDDLKIINITNKTSPTVVGSIGLGTSPNSVYIQGNFAYVIDEGTDDLKVIDISTPTTPSISGSIVLGVDPKGIAVEGNYAYVIVSASPGLRVVDISNPTAPTQIGSTNTGVNPTAIDVQGNYVYISNLSSNDMRVYDVIDPTTPTFVGSTFVSGPLSMRVKGNYAYEAGSNFNVIEFIPAQSGSSVTYLWSDGQTTETATALSAGIYSVIVTDSLGCADTCEITITEPALLVASCIIDSNVSCNEGNDAAASVSVTGGTLPYTYLWSNTATTSSISGLAAGTYSVIVTDSSGCSDTCEIIITTVLDTISPVGICQDITLYLDASGTANITAADIGSGSTDNCTIDTMHLSVYSFDCSSLLNSAPNAYALDFDGTNDYVNAGNILPVSYTKEAWILISSPNTVNNIVSGYNASSRHAFWSPAAYGYRLSAGHNGIWNSVQDPIPLVLGQWYHVAVTYNNATGEMILYKNGVQVDQTLGVASFSGSNATLVGSFDGGNLFKGQIDEVRIWDIIRTQTDIQNSMNTSLIGTESGLVAYYDMEDGPGSSTLTDISGNGNSGIMINMDPNNDFQSPGAPISSLSSNPLVSLYVSDLNGNIDSCVATVSILDTLSPIAICKNDTVYLDSTGNASITIADIDGGSTDNCSIDSMYISTNSFTCVELGVNTVILTVTDRNSNIDICYATVTVLDTISRSAAVWIGAIDNDWHKDGNWDCSVPDATTDVLIPTGTIPCIVYAGKNGICNTMVIESGAELIVQPTGKLEVEY